MVTSIILKFQLNKGKLAQYKLWKQKYVIDACTKAIGKEGIFDIAPGGTMTMA